VSVAVSEASLELHPQQPQEKTNNCHTHSDQRTTFKPQTKCLDSQKMKYLNAKCK